MMIMLISLTVIILQYKSISNYTLHWKLLHSVSIIPQQQKKGHDILHKQNEG